MLELWKRQMRLTLLISVILVAVSIQACSLRQVYEGVKQARVNECSKTQDFDRSRCLENTPESYDEYQRKRDEASSRDSDY